MGRAHSRRAVLRAAGLLGSAAVAAAVTGCTSKGGPASPAASTTAAASPLAVQLSTGVRDASTTAAVRSASPSGGSTASATDSASSAATTTGLVPHLLVAVSGGTSAARASAPVVVVTDSAGARVAGTTVAVTASPGAPASSGAPSATSRASSASASAADAALVRATGSGSVVQHTWSPTQPLTAGARYTARATAGSGSSAASGTLDFTTATDGQMVGARMQPLDGETVGVGMPVVVSLTSPVPAAQRSALTDAMTVDSGGVRGAWRWISPSEVHWRPAEYWPAGTEVHVRVPLSQLVLGGRHGKADRDVSFTVGDSHISTADTVTHQMTTRVNGQVVKVMPISAGREDQGIALMTRSGPHVVSEKYASYFMDGATVGLDYAETVQWATRIANSGEFVHAAPWSVAQQGHSNVSHGCINASPDDAHWFYDLARRGDVVEVTGTPRRLELTNGLGDWTLSWEQWTAPQV